MAISAMRKNKAGKRNNCVMGTYSIRMKIARESLPENGDLSEKSEGN